MSKPNRNKKTPMFVSSINSNYDFVDYTEPAQAPQSSFGNPNVSNALNPPPQSVQSPKKAETNWFDQMLDTQQPQNPTSPNRSPALSFQSSNVKADTFQANVNFNSSYQSPSFQYNIPANPTTQPDRLVVNQPGIQKQPQYNFGKKPNQPERPNITIGSPDQSAKFTTSTSPKYQSTKFQFSTPAYEEPKKYEFGNKKEFNYQTKDISATKFGNNYTNGTSSVGSYNEPVVAEKPKYQSFQPGSPSGITTTISSNVSTPKSPSSSGGFGFTDEALVNSLPEPARSNILAMIKRNKGL